jgi:hypothetical protein
MAGPGQTTHKKVNKTYWHWYANGGDFGDFCLFDDGVGVGARSGHALENLGPGIGLGFVRGYDGGYGGWDWWQSDGWC